MLTKKELNLADTWEKDDHSIIICHPGHTARCQLCEDSICALSESIERCASDPKYHLICRQCFEEILPSRTIQFAGRFRTNDEAKEVLKVRLSS